MNSSAQLPSEQTLPGKGAQPTELPAESTLPGSPSGKPAVLDQLPSENQLPGAATDPPDTTPKAIDGGNALPGGIQPILRLDYTGHSGGIRAIELASSPNTASDTANNGAGKVNSTNEKTLLTAGEDKDLHVWRRSPLGDHPWKHHRTIRWQVQRGPRGRIYALAANGNQIAMAGHGAMGSLGEIWIVDAISGKLVRPLVDFNAGHRQVVAALAWSPENDGTDQSEKKPAVLASQDVDGRVMTWQSDQDTGLWSGKTVIQPDSIAYGAEIASRIRSSRGFVPLAFRGANELVVAHFTGLVESEPNITVPTWQLQRIDLFSGKTSLLGQTTFAHHVRCVATAPDGSSLVAAGADGTLAVWDFDEKQTVTRHRHVQIGGRPLFVDLDASNQQLLVGTELAGMRKGQAVSRLQVWDLSGDSLTLRSETYPAIAIPAGQIDVERGEAIVAVNSEIHVYDIDDEGRIAAEPRERLDSPTMPIARVAFAKDISPYTIALTRGESNDFTDVFDLSGISLRGDAEIDADDYLPRQRLANRWNVRSEKQNGEIRFRLYRDEQPLGMLPLNPEVHGVVSAIGTIDAKEAGTAVVVGTKGRNNVYVYACDESDPPRLIRQFRGHSGGVRWISASGDTRFLATASDDATIKIWNLENLFSDSESIHRWGAEFEIEDGKLIATSVREAGPLYFRGVRDGDVLMSVGWADAVGDVQEKSDSESIREALLSLPFDTLVSFRFSRLGRSLETIQSFPAWRPLATLLVDRDREWAMWTPAGYYDASFNGHQRFGWQVNRGVQQLPDFFRAAQFRKTLERPDVIRRLLETGSLPAAMRRSLSRIDPPVGDASIVNQYLTKPHIELISPQSGELVRGDELVVRADIRIPLGTRLVDPKAFVSGVPATATQQVSDRIDEASGIRTLGYEWTFRVPSDPLLQLEVIAATDTDAVDRVLIRLPHERIGPPPRKPQMHLLAIGVGNYSDPQIQSLDFAASATTAVADTLRTAAGPLYNVTTEQLVDDQATRPLWKIYASEAVKQLSKTISPDDLVVMYLCGHGLHDRRNDQWYFVTHDADYRELMNDQYANCLSFEDLSLLASLPCRKLAILDSCHSGAVQSAMRVDDLKSALRWLQNDVVITITASEGDEEAAEVVESRLGRFTTRLIEALDGGADADGDGVVTLDETIGYVSRTVAEESQAEGMSQHPTASPPYLLDHLRLPLSAVKR
ncbi:WD-40 repeat protein [Rhodopirellula maiorica SM1]|uniref:WD-40 repeat protein n=1 Tax=Rhodopirellula maiorica SM1 TaxID=1265738 RepID=M5RYB7_9BACT|nr:caspase family protein [Rhodopirellula maiorica]EMI20387.1 WD-40 repeat protein [Rhodopirellula maiorica SM1]